MAIPIFLNCFFCDYTLKSSHDNPRTVLCRIVNLRQKFSEMWSPIAPLRGFAIKTEAIISWRSAYHISIRTKNASSSQDPHKALRGCSMPPKGAPVIGTPWRTWDMMYKKFPDMHALF